MKTCKLFVVSQRNYHLPFKNQFDLVDTLEESDVVMFTGGEDVSPDLYLENPASQTMNNPARDSVEASIFSRAKRLKKKFIGICRGSQFLTVMAGGKLVQHVTGHGLPANKGHSITTREGDTVVISSTHHQMMHPDALDKKDYLLLAWANGLSQCYLGGGDQPIPHSGIEPEIVWYPRIKALCIQGHPEYMDPLSDGVRYCQQLVKEYLL